MNETFTIEFTDEDARDLAEFKQLTSYAEPIPVKDSKASSFKRRVIELPAIEASTEKATKAVEDAIKSGSRIKGGSSNRLPPELVEKAKAAFISSGGNISEVSALYDLTPESVLRLASQENWPIYNGTTKLSESHSKGQLHSLQAKLWGRIEIMLEAMDVETKARDDLTQHRAHSEYVEPLSARSTAFKTLMDQYMRVSTILEPELFSDDPEASNYHASKARREKYAGGVEGVNREIADFFSQVVVGIADRISDREMSGYGEIIDARAEDD